MTGLDTLGAEMIGPRAVPWSRGALAVAAGVVGAVLVRKHPVLAGLGAAALASNAHAVVIGERTWKDAVRRMGRHVVATAGSLAMPKYPAIGYIGGAVAADLLIDGEGGGIIEEFARYENVTDEPARDIIDAEVISVKPVKKSKALVKR